MTIIEVLQAIQRKLNAPKTQYNKFGNYYYRNCEDILEAVKPLLAEYKAAVTISDEVVQMGDRFYVKATATLLCGGEKISVNAQAREPQTKKGMDEAQITGATSSYARKYALNGLFAIDDNKDPDTQNNYNSLNDKAVQEIETLATKANVDTSKLLKKYKVKSISELDANQAKECIDGLKKMVANG